MRAKLMFGAAIFAAAFGAMRAEAAFLTGQKLLDMCTSDSSVDSMDCLGYTTGVADATVGIFWCSSEKVTRRQVKQIAINWLRDHPEKWHYSADSLVATALENTWPCPKPTPAPRRNSSPAG